MNNLISHIEWSLIQTDQDKSKIDKRILKMEGMSGRKTRHFYNNICSMDEARYLEIGTWKGSSLCSAMYGNDITCVAIDNWSEFGGPKWEFIQNYNEFKGKNKATFIEKNCWEVDVSTIGKFNIYMYDGNHTETSHYEALNHYLPCLDDEFIYLVDDWNVEPIQHGTLASIKDNNCKILYQKEIFTPSNDHNNDWHNGISIFVLKKTTKNKKRTDLEIIDEVEKIRTKNNVNWMDILRLAFKNSPEDARKLIGKVNEHDGRISELLKELSNNE